ncbi:unnamed protein product [Brachionus calyciflorus]|uniref:Uncharacterized protein n=1 Tax=Brachionus calyciflorus TaxID=104777 RepID=A0A814CTV3_9BILA|nr:unnamed protein product [Brachionus calyciflorus]
MNRENYSKIQRLQSIDNMLNESLPSACLILISLVNILIATGSFTIQIVSILNQTPLYFLATGIWFGIFLIFTEIISLILSNL